MQSTDRLRFHFIDFSRAVLFSLGIVLHAAWICRDRSVFLQGLHDFIHSFRMPAFFLIAGFFCAAMLTRYSAEVFLSKRLRRLGIPLLFFVLIDVVVNCPNHTNWTDYSVELTGRYWVSGDWLEHLWFLGTLIAYILALFLVQKAWPSISARVRNAKFALVGFVALISIASVVFTHVERLFPPTPWAKVWFFVDQIKFFQYAAFFAAGYIIFHHQHLLLGLTNRVALNIGNAIAFWIAMPLLLNFAAGRYLIQLWQPIYGLSMCGLLFFVAMRFFNQRQTLVSSLSEASYTIYLVHWPVMIALQRIIDTPQTPLFLTFSMLVVFTAILSYACHIYLVKKSHLLAFLMNGQPIPAAAIALDEPSAPKPAIIVAAIPEELN